MTDSYAEIYLHCVWATKYREATIPDELTEAVYRAIGSEALRLGCQILEVGGTDDHVHVLLVMSRTATVARLVNQLKGVSSHLLNPKNRARGDAPTFRWQNGYGVFSVGRDHVESVRHYVRNQKQHHAADKLWPEWEPGDAATPHYATTR